MKNILNKTAICLLLGFGVLATSCSSKDDWNPGPMPADNNPGVYFDMVLSPQSAEMDPLDPTNDNFSLILGRTATENALEVPITVLQADEGLTIPSTVVFAAGAATATFNIKVAVAEVQGVLSYALKFDDTYFNPYYIAGPNNFKGEVLVPEEVTPDNIATYVQGANVKAAEAFLNGGTASYRITLMSELLDGWRQEYTNYASTLAKPFSHYSILLPRGEYQISMVANYTPTGLWYMGPPSGTTQGVFPMTGAGNNPLCDVSLAISRSSSSGSPSSGYNTAGTGAHKFYSFLDQAREGASGFTIIRDRDNATIFWFRSKADPNNWFKCERY